MNKELYNKGISGEFQNPPRKNDEKMNGILEKIENNNVLLEQATTAQMIIANEIKTNEERLSKAIASYKVIYEKAKKIKYGKGDLEKYFEELVTEKAKLDMDLGFYQKMNMQLRESSTSDILKYYAEKNNIVLENSEIEEVLKILKFNVFPLQQKNKLDIENINRLMTNLQRSSLNPKLKQAGYWVLLAMATQLMSDLTHDGYEGLKKNIVHVKINKKRAIIKCDRLIIREEPSKESRQIGFLKLKEEVEILKEETFWIKVRIHDSKEGWIHKNYVEIKITE